MSTSSLSVATPTMSQFSRRLDDIKPSKSDINFAIMDYLLSEGYAAAAQKFASEANIDPQFSKETIEARVAIRNAILSGHIDTAIEKINEMGPEILDKDSSLHFSLLRLQLIEIIRRGDPDSSEDLMTAIGFANKQLAPRAKGKPEFIEELERGMALLIFPSDNLPPVLKSLLNPTLRMDIASRVNQAILRSQDSRSETQIKSLIKLRQWSEQKCRDAKKPIPTRISLGLDGDDSDVVDGRNESETMNGNGESDLMVQ